MTTGATPPDPGGQPGASPPTTDPDPGGTPQGTTFTQEQVAHLIAEEKRKANAKFADYDDVKRKLSEVEAAGQSELERAQTAAKDAEARATEASLQRNRIMARSAVTAAAARAGAVDPDVVVALLSEGITVTDKGEIEGDVDKLVAELLEAKPYLRNGNGSVNHGSADGGAHSRGAPTDTPSGTMNNLLRKNR